MTPPDAPDRPDASGPPDDGALDAGLRAGFRTRGRAGEAPSVHSSPAHSVLTAIEGRTGQSAKVLLRDTGSEHGVSPVMAAAPDPGEELPAGRGQYQVLGELARGGMGAILKGHDTDLGRDVAMKVLLERHADNPAILQRFVEEAQIGGQLQHPGIVPVYELGLMADDRPYFTMKLVKGRTLAALLAQRRSVTDDRRRFLSIWEQICQTLAYAHARRVIHRDLKPANIMVGAFGEVQVVDWGLAKVLHEGGVDDERLAQREQTQVSIIETVRSGSSAPGTESLVGSVMGTPAYMSPEQAQGEIDLLDERTDVFALGAILCEILTGAPPYGGDREDILDDAARARLGPARERLAACGADEELVDLVNRCLSPARRARPRNAEVLVEEMHAYLSAIEEKAHEARVAAAEARVKAEQERKARRLTLALAATILLAVVGGGWAWRTIELRAERQRENVVQKVTALLGESNGMLAQGLFGSARTTVDQAGAALELTDPLPDLASRIDAQRERVDTAAAAAAVAAANEQRIVRFLGSLDVILFDDTASNPNRVIQAARSEAFATTFAGAGMDPLERPIEETAHLVRETGHAEEIAFALDEWSRLLVRRQGFNSQGWVKLLQLAMEVDPDPARLRMRRAILADDRRALEELVAADEARTWSPQTIATFGQTIETLGHNLDIDPLYRECAARHPDDFLINLIIGYRAQDSGRTQEALRYYQAALAVRPHHAWITTRVARGLALNGDPHGAEILMRAVLQRHPDQDWLLQSLAHVATGYQTEGEWESALTILEDGLALHPDHAEALNNLAWFLSICPPRLRDAERGLQAARRAVELSPAEWSYVNTLALAEYRAGNFRESVARCEQSIREAERADFVDWTVLAMSLHALGREDEARQAFDFAVSIVESSQADADEVRSFLEEATETLGVPMPEGVLGR